MRKLLQASETTNCSECGAAVRRSQYEGAEPRWNTVSDAGRDLPGGHAVTCRSRR